MTSARLVLLFCFCLFFCLLSHTGCAFRNRFQSGRDLSYEVHVTVSPSAQLEGFRLPSVAGLVRPTALGGGDNNGSSDHVSHLR